MASVLVAGPALEPVSLTEAKLHLRVDGNDENTLVTALIAAARQAAESYTRRAFVTQTWRYTCDRLGSAFTLPWQPVQSVDEVAVDGTVIPEASYELDAATGRLRPLVPYVAMTLGGVAVEYTAGYGDTAADVPAPLRQAMLLMIGHWYEHREAVITGPISTELPLTARALLAPYRVMLV